MTSLASRWVLLWRRCLFSDLVTADRCPQPIYSTAHDTITHSIHCWTEWCRSHLQVTETVGPWLFMGGHSDEKWGTIAI